MSRDAMQEIGPALAAALGTRVDPQPERAVHGGCISECVRWGSARGPLFVKIGAPSNAAAFDAEAAGLENVMDRCMKIEHGRIYGGLNWVGVNTRIISSKRPRWLTY